ncbi:MAG: NUDIX domain-containing protein [Candidatus Moranbacteria bacterium]|nr:NUDIX domain-containing protein [Candidatus Moranbacteria bacterium]
MKKSKKSMKNKDENKKNIFETIDRYFLSFPEDIERLEKLHTQRKLQDDLGNRKNFRGHITASGFVVHKEKLLLIFHNQFQIFLQPGGHFERDGSIEECARREVREETSLEVAPHSWHKENGNIPIYIDTHSIPSSKEKQEEDHFHHDHLFLYSLKDSRQEIQLQVEEVKKYAWISFEEITLCKESLQKVYQRIQELKLSFE